ncbi:MAG: hypothetical protein ACKVT1_13000 [Dehalococcoidia bacterium]
MTRSSRIAAIAAACVAASALLIVLALSASAQSSLPKRGFLAMVANDGTPTAGINLPPPDPAYCQPANAGSAPPNTVLGSLTIGGSPAPAGTLVQVVLDGKVGPAAVTRAAGGYRLDYAAGIAGCSNRVGASVGVLVNSQVFDSGVKVGDAAGVPFLRFDVAAP